MDSSPEALRAFYERGHEESRLAWLSSPDSFATLVWRELYRECLSLLDPRPGERILDAGSNENTYAQEIRRRGARYFSLDISLTALKRFRKTHDVDCVVGDIQRLPFKDRAFDKALASEVIEHVPQPLDGMAELARVSSRYAVLSTAPFNGLVRKLFFRLFVDPAHNRACLEKTGHLFEFEPAFVDQARQRFDVLKVKGMGVIQFPRTAARGLLKRPLLQNTLGPLCAFLDRLACRLPFAYLLGNRIFIRFRGRAAKPQP